jgi:lysophospholipase L1-like esterase
VGPACGGSDRRARGHFFLVVVATLATLVIIGAVVYAAMSRQRTTALATRPIATALTAPASPPMTAPAPTSTAPPTTTAPAPPVSALPARPSPEVLVVGDSIAEFTGQALAWDAAPAGTPVVNAAMEGCGVMAGSPLHYAGNEQQQPDGCDNWPARWQADVDFSLPNVTMLMVGRWEVVDRVIDGQWRAIGDPVFDQDLDNRLETAVRILTSRGGNVVITTAPYYLRAIPPGGGLYPEDEPSRVDAFNAEVRAVAARHPGRVVVAEFGAELCPDGVYTDDVGGVRVRRDGVHLTEAGSSMVAGWLLPQLLSAAAPPTG